MVKMSETRKKDMFRVLCAIGGMTLIFLLSCGSANKAQEEKIAAIKNFYSLVLDLKNDGIPKNEDIEKLSPFISASFRNLLLAARKTEDRYFHKTKGEVPPLMQGSLFFSLFEGAHKLISINKEGKGRSFLITLEYQNPYGKKEIVQWQDRAILVKENDKWVVHDIELLGKWQFGSKGKLSEILIAVSEEEKNL